MCITIERASEVASSLRLSRNVFKRVTCVICVILSGYAKLRRYLYMLEMPISYVGRLFLWRDNVL